MRRSPTFLISLYYFRFIRDLPFSPVIELKRYAWLLRQHADAARRSHTLSSSFKMLTLFQPPPPLVYADVDDPDFS